ncbi:MAG: CapA family protein, partial [Enterococcus sp.]|nr:CapA family protein [Enterococcus sp.]
MSKFIEKKYDKLSIVFTGDVGFDRYMEGRWEDENLLSPKIIDFCKDADHVITNVEGPLLDQETNKTTSGTVQLVHTMNPRAIRVFDRIGSDIWNICNNHIMDAGPEGIERTLAEAENNGAKLVGAGMNLESARRPIFLGKLPDELEDNDADDKPEYLVGIFSAGYRRGCKPARDDYPGCLMWNDFESIQKSIDDIKKRAKKCILIAHAGEEFTSLPSPYTR